MYLNIVIFYIRLSLQKADFVLIVPRQKLKIIHNKHYILIYI